MKKENKAMLKIIDNVDAKQKVLEQALVGRTIIKVNALQNWIQLDNGRKVYLEQDEVDNIL